MASNEAPREVWIEKSEALWLTPGAGVIVRAKPRESDDVRYVRADLVPSVPPVGERERRLADAVVYLLGDLHEVKDDKPDGWADSIVAEARAILSSPAPPAGEIGLLDEIVAWQRATFPNKTPESCAAHLLEEARELRAAPTDPEEAADVFHLLLGVADSCGYDLFEVTRAKFEKNKLRDWSAPPNAEGYVKAAPDPASEPRAKPGQRTGFKRRSAPQRRT